MEDEEGKRELKIEGQELRNATQKRQSVATEQSKRSYTSYEKKMIAAYGDAILILLILNVVGWTLYWRCGKICQACSWNDAQSDCERKRVVMYKNEAVGLFQRHVSQTSNFQFIVALWLLLFALWGC